VIIVTGDHGLHFPEFADDLDAVLARAAGVRRMVTIGTDALSFTRCHKSRARLAV